MISADTLVFGVIGERARQSWSPTLHGAWFRDRGLDAVYVAFPAPASPRDLPAALRDLGISGANVTTPYKQVVLAGVDHVDPLAAAVGAANTLVQTAGRSIQAFNTDVEGFQRAVLETGPPPGVALVVGAGGAARAVVAALSAWKARSVVVARDRGQAERCAQVGEGAQAADFGAWTETLRQADLVINALPPAADPLVRSLPLTGLRPGARWIDLNYGLPRPHLDHLRAEGHVVQDGLAMLLHQGALAFHHFTGMQPDLEVGRRALLGASARSAR
jgi:shikimate dehydrogenase